VAFLLETTALAELAKPRPNAGFLKWLSANAMDDGFIASLSIGEIESGIAMLSDKTKQHRLEAWLDRLVAEYADRILPFDEQCARVWGKAVGKARRRGTTPPIIDSQIAAIAYVHELPILTRNVRHFRIPPFDKIRLLNPWE
jgi:predicted nucleic acid-binding protein